jgi:hypothetical protein
MAALQPQSVGGPATARLTRREDRSAPLERGPENLNNRAAANCIHTYRAPPEPSGAAAYHRAAATRARRLREEATTRPIAQHEQIAEEIERATEVRPNKEPAEDETGVV